MAFKKLLFEGDVEPGVKKHTELTDKEVYDIMDHAIQSVMPLHLRSIEYPVHGEVPTYEEVTGRFKWAPAAAVPDHLEQDFTAGATISAKQLVSMLYTGKVSPTDAFTAFANVGAAKAGAAADQTVRVITSGKATCIADGSITAGNLVRPSWDVTGRVTAFAPSGHVHEWMGPNTHGETPVYVKTTTYNSGGSKNVKVGFYMPQGGAVSLYTNPAATFAAVGVALTSASDGGDVDVLLVRWVIV